MQFIKTGFARSEQNLYRIIAFAGREHTWLYASKKGRENLAQMACYRRLAIVTMHRGHHYPSIDEIKSELSMQVMLLAPPQMNINLKVRSNNNINIIKQIFIQDVHFNKLKTAVINVCPVC